MNGEFVAFFILSLSAIIGGVLMLNLTKVMHMMLALVLIFLSIAGLYFLLSAEFIGVAQILLYSGAITIIMIFGIMLTKHNAENESRLTLRKWIIFFAVVAFGAVMYFAVNNVDFANESTQGSLPLHENNTLQIGTLLYSKYIIPFELTSVILLVALVGAIILAKRTRKRRIPMSSVPASAYLTLAIILFCIGLFGALTKRNTVIVLVCIELMLNAANLNLVAFSKLGLFPNLTGQIFSLFTMAVAAAEAAVGLAILIALYRNRTTVQVDEMDTLKG